MGAALAFPFLLLRHRPLLVLLCVAAACALRIGIDQASALAGYATGELYAQPLELPWQIGVRTVIECVLLAFPAGALFAGALIELGQRTAKPSFGDGIIWGGVSLAYLLVVFAPIFATAAGAYYFLTNRVVSASEAFGDPSSIEMFPSLAPALLLFGAYVLIALIHPKFALSWPHSLSIGRIAPFSGWQLSKKRYWRILGALAAIYALAGIFSYAFYALAEVTGLQVMGLPFEVARSLVDSLAAYFVDAAVIAFYVRVLPPRPEKLADTFQ